MKPYNLYSGVITKEESKKNAIKSFVLSAIACIVLFFLAYNTCKPAKNSNGAGEIFGLIFGRLFIVTPLAAFALYYANKCLEKTKTIAQTIATFTLIPFFLTTIFSFIIDIIF